MNSEILEYDTKYREQLMKLIRMNIPEYFHASEEADFASYLMNEIEDYFVYQIGQDIVGCGGLNYKRPNEGIISWDMIHPQHHGKGIGKALVEHRLNHLRKQEMIRTVTVRTSQLAFRFYEKFGFKLHGVQKDGWAPGFDIYNMSMSL